MAVKIPVIIEVEPDRFSVEGERRKDTDHREEIAKLVKLGLRAKLAMQSVVTGQLMIDMDLRPELPARLVGGDFRYPEIPTVKSTLAEIAETIQELPIKQMFNKLEKAIDNVSETLGDPALKDIVASAKGAVESADRLLKDADKLVIKVDKKVGPLADSFTTAAEDAQRLLENIDSRVEPMTMKIEKTFDAAEAALVEAKKTLQGIEEFTAEDSALRYRLNTALDELARAARSLRVLSDYLEQYPDAMLRGKGGPGGK
jgi:paraquat-inducible protein B